MYSKRFQAKFVPLGGCPSGTRESLLFEVGNGDQTNHTALVPEWTHSEFKGASRGAVAKFRQMVAS